jgi:lantibiotic modifying enzyme
MGIYRYCTESGIRQDIEQALRQCREHYWMSSQCLCHGSLGNLEPLIIACHQFPEFGDCFNLVETAAGRVLTEIQTGGWRSMLPNQTLNQALMTGVSGIGYAFLRLHNPADVPSVLSLDGPCSPEFAGRVNLPSK